MKCLLRPNFFTAVGVNNIKETADAKRQNISTLKGKGRMCRSSMVQEPLVKVAMVIIGRFTG